MISDKKGLEHLSLLLIAKKVKHIVFSPGSRNAPMIATFPRYTEFTCYSIVDERSAAFFALGLAQKTGETVVLSCTSGSALLNYAPALAEAYYQKIPLLVLSADRPENMIDRGDGQTIRQQNVYANFIRKSIQLPEEIETEEKLIEYQQLALEAIVATQFPCKGPAHINIPFSEPIYNQKKKEFPTIIPINSPTYQANLLEGEYINLAETWSSSRKTMILIGQQKPNAELNELLEILNQDPSIIILSETTSNAASSGFINSIDKTLATIELSDLDLFLPDLLISINSAIVSKKIKAFLRSKKAYDHWHIDLSNEVLDTYFHLTRTIPEDAVKFLKRIIPLLQAQASNFKMQWLKQKEIANARHDQFLKSTSFSDLQIFNSIIQQLPKNSNVHFANSTPVRYSQLFDLDASLVVDSNRGTSGIDGSISTAVGAALTAKEITTIITGDLSFFYDSNALWNQYVSPNIRIIVINNSGGNIFRFIDGPSELPELETFFETKHSRKAKSLAEEAGLDYFSASNLDETETILSSFFEKSKHAKLIEIFTPNIESAETLKSYFKFLQKG